MKYLLSLLLSFFSGQLFSQLIPQIGELNFKNSKITKVDTILENICGHTTKVIRLTILAKTKVQISCNYGNPSLNIYDTITNKAYVCYSYDSTGIIRNSIICEIKNYVEEQTKWAKQYNNNYDFSYLPFYKSFYVNGTRTVPFIWTGAERTGDYQIFYLDKQVYKIILLESDGLGCLSLFVDQNIYFSEKGIRINLGELEKNIDKIKKILVNY